MLSEDSLGIKESPLSISQPPALPWTQRTEFTPKNIAELEEFLDALSELGIASPLHKLDLSKLTIKWPDPKTLQAWHISQIITLCPNITSLDLRSSMDFGDLRPLTGLQNLQILSLYDLNKIPPDFREFPKLHTLHCDFWQMTDVKFLENCQTIENLSFKICGNLTDISSLGTCANLTHLSLYCCRKVDISTISNCKKLVTLDLSATYIQDLSPLYHLEKLEKINLRLCNAVLDIEIQKLRKNMPYTTIIKPNFYELPPAHEKPSLS